MPRVIVFPNESVNYRGNSLAAWQGAQNAGVGVGHAKGWRLAAEAMGVEWMSRDGTSQAIPPVMTRYIGGYLLDAIREGHE